MKSDEPQCPKRCDVATPPEVEQPPRKGQPGIYVCTGCGHRFRWNGPAECD